MTISSTEKEANLKKDVSCAQNPPRNAGAAIQSGA
jgi:hypothetical protein